jgi:hypothetical protein
MRNASRLDSLLSPSPSSSPNDLLGVFEPGGASRQVSVEGERLTLKVFLGRTGWTRFGPVCVVDNLSPDSIAEMMGIAGHLV